MALTQERWGIIYNPKAGTRKTEKRWNKIREYLAQKQVAYDFVQSESFKSVERLATMLANNGYRTIVIVGGDGALNDAINGIFHASIPQKSSIALAVIPAGIGNDYAHYWDIRFDDYRQAIDHIIAHRTRLVDVGVCTFTTAEGEQKRYFLNTLQIGLGSRIVSVYDNIHRFWGLRKMWINVTLLRLLFERTLYRMHLRIDNEHIRGDIMAVCIGNARGYGFTPDAVPYNGMLDVSVFYRPEWWEIFSGIWMFSHRSILNYKQLKPYRTKQLLVVRTNGAEVSLDGRMLSEQLPLRVSIESEAIQFVIP